MINLRFERGLDDRAGGAVGPTLGPYDWVQLTYGTIRVSPDGEEVAALDIEGDGYWHTWQSDGRWSYIIIS